MDADVISGNLSDIAPAGSRESIVVILPDIQTNLTHHFRIRAVDNAGNLGGMSSIVSVYLFIPPPVIITTDAPTTLTEKEISVPTDTTSEQTEKTGVSSTTVIQTTRKSGTTTPGCNTITEPKVKPTTPTSSTSPQDQPQPEEPNTALIIGVSCGAAVVIILIIIFVTIPAYRKYQVQKEETKELPWTENGMAHTNPTYEEPTVTPRF